MVVAEQALQISKSDPLKDDHRRQKFHPQDQITSDQGNDNPQQTENKTKHNINKKYWKTTKKLQQKYNHSEEQYNQMRGG